MTMTKYCLHCKTVYELSAFFRDKKSKDGLRSQCKSCQAVKYKPRIEHGRKRAIQVKLDYGKCDCHGIVVTLDNFGQFEWDHIEPKLKRFEIGSGVHYSDKLFYQELAKCRLVCRSYHVVHTRQQRIEGLIGTNHSTINSLVIQKPAHQESLFEGM